MAKSAAMIAGARRELARRAAKELKARDVELPTDEASLAARAERWGGEGTGYSSDRLTRAADQGYNRQLYHSTPEVFDEFDPDMVDIGTHMGTAEQAAKRSSRVGEERGYLDQDPGTPNTMPLRYREGNTLEMEDVGAWNDSFRVLEELRGQPGELGQYAKDTFDEAWEMRGSFEGTDEWLTSPENREFLDEINSKLQGEGYDTVKYRNAVENMHGMSAGVRPENADRRDQIWADRQAIFDAERARRPRTSQEQRLDELFKDPDVTPEQVEEVLKTKDVGPNPEFTPEEQAQIDSSNAELAELDAIQREDSNSYIALDPANIRSEFAEFNPENEGKAQLLGGLGAAGVVAGGAAAPQEAEAGILRPASMNIVDRLIQLDMLKKPDSPQAVKNALKRYNDSMKSSRAFAEREAKAAAGEFKTDFERADLGERKIISPESLQGSQLAAVRGDPSDIGTLRSNAGVQLPRDVNVEGGNRFSQRHAEDEFGWASAPEVAAGAHGKLQQIAQNTGDDVVAVYNRMGDESTNFSTPIAESMHLEAMGNNKIAKKDKAAFDQILRKTYPDWVGLDNPDALAQLMGTNGYPRVGKMRTAYAKLMGQDAFLKRGFPAYKPLIEGTQDADLAGTQLGDAGLSIYRPDTDKPAAAFDQHGTYEYQMPGQYMGGLGQSFPFEDIFPKSYAEQMGRVTKGDAPRPLPRAEKGFTREQAIDAINKRTDQYELADQEWVDNIMPKWEASQNKETGNADPRLLAGTAAGTGLAAAALAPGQAEASPFNAANKADIQTGYPQVTPETRRADDTNRQLDEMRVANMRRNTPRTQADRTFAGDMRGIATTSNAVARGMAGMTLGGLKAIWDMAGGAAYSDAVGEIDEMTAWAMEGFDPSAQEQLDMENFMSDVGESTRAVFGDTAVDLYNTGFQRAGDAAYEQLDEWGWPKVGAAVGAAIQGLEVLSPI